MLGAHSVRDVRPLAPEACRLARSKSLTHLASLPWTRASERAILMARSLGSHCEKLLRPLRLPWWWAFRHLSFIELNAMSHLRLTVAAADRISKRLAGWAEMDDVGLRTKAWSGE